MAIILIMIYLALIAYFDSFNNSLMIDDYFFDICQIERYSKLINFYHIIKLTKNYSILFTTLVYFVNLSFDLFLDSFKIDLFYQKIFYFFIEIFPNLIFI
jgi:hypothetical protein